MTVSVLFLIPTCRFCFLIVKEQPNVAPVSALKLPEVTKREFRGTHAPCQELFFSPPQKTFSHRPTQKRARTKNPNCRSPVKTLGQANHRLKNRCLSTTPLPGWMRVIRHPESLSTKMTGAFKSGQNDLKNEPDTTPWKDTDSS